MFSFMKVATSRRPFMKNVCVCSIFLADSSSYVVCLVTSLMMDNVMDPYFRFEVTHPLSSDSNSLQRSSSKDNQENPKWKAEEFSFLLDEEKGPGQLEVTLWDANYVIDSMMSEPVVINLSNLEIGTGFKKQTLKIHVSLFILLVVS